MGNVALGKTTTGIATIPPYTGDRALNADFSPLQRWVGIATKNASFTIDLVNPYFINGYVASSMTAATGASPMWTAPGYCNSGYTLSGSNDNVNFVTIDTASSGNVSTFTRTFTPVTVKYRYINVKPSATIINPQLASVVNFQLNEVPLLANLAISTGTLTPAFNPNTISYAATVDASATSVVVTPAAANSTYNVKVNGTVVAYGANITVALVSGANTIPVIVTSPIDGVTKTYTLVVTRPAPPSKYLSNITMSDGTNNVAIAPAFSGKTTFAYTASVPYATTSVMVTPTSEQTTETITVNTIAVPSGTASGAISLTTGSGNVIKVISTASDGTSQEYDITVTRAGNPNLTGLVVTYAGKTPVTLVLAPAFTSAGHSYTASLPKAVTTVSVTATAQDPNSKLTLGVNTLTSGITYSYVIGATATSIEIDITQADGTVATPYIITLTRT